MNNESASGVLEAPPLGECSAPPPLPPPSKAASAPRRPSPPAPQPVLPDIADDAVSDADLAFSFTDLLYQMPSWLLSMVFHLSLMIVLALWATSKIPHGDGGSEPIVATRSEPTDGLEDEEDGSDKIDSDELELPKSPAMETMSSSDPLGSSALSLPASEPLAIKDALASISGTKPLEGGISELGSGLGSSLEGVGGALSLGDDPADMLKGRLSAATRRALVTRDGGTQQSEDAVDRALQWLANHQLSDGSWSFDHTHSPKCRGKCSHPGSLANARIASTAIALLPFLGKGYTHKEGMYKKNVDQGLYYLTHAMKPHNGSLHELGGNMYGHGLAAIVLCEAYGLTHDKQLEKPAQMSINFIAAAQDPDGGGWRYEVYRPGDTSVFGWQLMALKSAHMAYLKVPATTVRGASSFLDEVQDDYGARYGYTGPGGGQATSAIGLLGRLYLGWKPQNEVMQRGVKILSEIGPSIDTSRPERNNMYYNYYATQVMHHVGGYPWSQWNLVMRDYLVKTQAKNGHEVGSWYFDGSDAGNGQGARLYYTALSAMILEVYYRHMPLYTQQSVQDEFAKQSLAVVRFMRIIPVIDFKGGVVVRGIGGRRDEYRPIVSKIAADAQSVTVARAFVERGFQEAYVADLDAIAGEKPAWQVYEECAASGLRLWVDAGLNCESLAEKLARFKTQGESLAGIVVGLESIKDPAMIGDLLNVIGGERCTFSLDLRHGKLITSVSEWCGSHPLAIVEEVLSLGIQRIIVLDLAQVGEGRGVGTESLCRQIRELDTKIELIAGGGVRDAADLNRLSEAGCDAVLVASALHDGRLG